MTKGVSSIIKQKIKPMAFQNALVYSALVVDEALERVLRQNSPKSWRRLHLVLRDVFHRVHYLNEIYMKYIYAIGDIHGRDHLLEKMYLRIETDPYRPAEAGKPIVIHIGDYIDGCPNSDRVLDLVMKGSLHFDSIALLGNHEALMLNCLDTDDRDVWWNWISNGGDKTLEAFGVSNRFGGYNPKDLSDALGPERIHWLQNLPLYHIADPYLFVHAGIVPDRPLDEQKKKDLLWIRSRFLESDVKHPYIVVHGHTQTENPELLPNRIGIDTGAARPKTLTAVVLDSLSEPRFIGVS